MINSNIAKVVISGTFRKNLDSLQAQYHELIGTNCQVLSPRSLEFDSEDFVRTRSESGLSIKSIQDNHLVSLKEADFMWLHCPNGYIGNSGAFEVGFARALNVPVFSKEPPRDEMISKYVTVCSSVYEAKQLVSDLK